MATDTRTDHSDGVGSPARERRSHEDIVVPETVGPNALARQYRAEHLPNRAPHETAALLLARAGDRLEYRAAADYIASAGKAIRKQRVPADVQLSDEAIRLALDAPLSWVTEDWYHVERPWESLPADELMALLSVGFGEDARMRELVEAREAGELEPASLDRDDYEFVFGADRTGEAYLTVFLGWVPGAVAGVVAAIVVGLATGSAWLALGVAIGAPVLGYLLTLIRAEVLDDEDRRHHLGDDYERRYGTLYLGSGLIVAVVLSILALVVDTVS